jgi:membrane associated rhomboid family serine protease
MHLIGNMLYLWIFGDNVEDSMGHGRFVVFYLLCGVAAALAQALPDPHSQVPMIGASGAISALVGAYSILYGQRRPSKYPPAVARWLHIVWLAVAWIVVQLMLGLVSRTEGMAIAAAAHIGGFIAGLVLARPMLAWRYRKA